MSAWKSVLVTLLLVNVCNTTTFPFREVLNLKLFSRNEGPEYLPSYAAQSMISLFCKNHSDSPGPALFRATVLRSIMEKPGSVIEKGDDFEYMILDKSHGLLGGFFEEENNGPEPPFEFLSLYEGSERKTMRKSLISELDVVLVTNAMMVENWPRRSIAEAAISWRLFRKFFKYLRCDGRVLDLGIDVFDLNGVMLELDESIPDLNPKLFNLEDKYRKDNIETRLNIYLNRYEMFLKPGVLKFTFAYSYPKMTSMFYFFQYLHQISRVYAGDLSSTIVERLQREHKEFVNDAIEFVTNLTATERTLKAALPFDGWLYFNQELIRGILVPSALHSATFSSQYANHSPLVKVSLYYVNFTPWKNFKHASFSHIQKIDDENSYELILHTSREDFDEVWLEKLVRKLSGSWTNQDDLMNFINS